MKRRISIFAFLLCAFAAVGLTEAVKADVQFWVYSTHRSSVSVLGKEYDFDRESSYYSGYYHVFNNIDCGITDLRVIEGTANNSITANDVDGLRFKGWYTSKSGWKSTWPVLSEATDCISTAATIYSDDIKGAGQYDPRGNGDALRPTIIAVYVPVHVISTTVSPDGAGTVTVTGGNGDGTVDEGEDVTLTATANAGWTFLKWSDGNTDSVRKIEKVDKAMALTAQFTAKGYSVSKVPENAKITVADTGTYNEDLQIGWESEGTEGYDYKFVSAQVLNGDTELAKYETGTFAAFNMKDVCGQHYPNVKVVVKYEKTGQNRDLKFQFNEGIATIGYKIGAAAEWTVITAAETIPIRVGTEWQAYATAKDGYVYTATTAERPYSSTMGANGAVFSPKNGGLDGFTLTVDPNGGFFHGSQEKYTFNLRLRAGLTNLNEIGTVTFTNGSSLIEFRDEKGEPVYDAFGHNVNGTYWTADYPNGTFRGTGNLTVKAIPGQPTPQFTISTSVHPEGSGNAEGAGRYNQGSKITLAAKENTGYVFEKWSDGPTESTREVIVESNATYTAVFTGKVYTVMFIGMGGTPPVVNADVRVGGKWGLFFPEVTYTGYKLRGWYSDASCTEKINADDSVPAVPPSPLYAGWEEVKEFTVTFADPDGGHPDVDKTCAKNQPIGSAPDETKSWKRDGYLRDNSSDWNPSLTTVVTSNMTVNAVWKSLSNVLDCSELLFSIEPNSTWKVDEDDWHAGDSSLLITERSATVSDIVSTSVTEPGKLSFRWKAAESTTLSVKLGPSGEAFAFEAKADMTDWAEGVVEIKEASAGSPVEVDFYFATGDFPVSSGRCALDHVTWAPGIASVSRVTLDPNGGSGGTDEVQATFGEDMPKLELLPQLAHHAFLGYFDAQSGGTKYYNADGTSAAKWDKEGDTEQLFAHWQEDGKFTLTVSADASRGTVAKDPDEGSYYAGTDVMISATPNPGYLFEKWSDGSALTPRQVSIASNASYTASFTACVYRVTLDPNGGSGGVAETWATYGERLPDLASLPAKSPDSFDGYYDAATGGTQCYDKNGKGLLTWTRTSGAELFARWAKDVGDISRALDCDNLVFSATGEWHVETDPDFAHKDGGGNDQYLRAESASDGLSVTISESGTLTFFWRAQNDETQTQLKIYRNGEEASSESIKVVGEYEDPGWQRKDLAISATPEHQMTVKLVSVADVVYWAVDRVTWTPEGGGEPTLGDPVEVTAAGVTDGEFSLTIPTESGADYGVWTNADLTVDSWGLMGEPKPGKGQPMEFKWTILPGFPQLFFKAHKVEYK